MKPLIMLALNDCERHLDRDGPFKPLLPVK